VEEYNVHVDDIEIFLTLARTFNLSKTAEQLHLSQSTISRRLKVLENNIGIKLFERKRGQKKIKVTPKGQQFVFIAQRWSTLWQEIYSLRNTAPHLSLSIGSVDSLNTTFLLPFYQKLVKHTPKTKLKILTSTSPELYELLEKHEIDVGFVLREISSKNIISEQIFSEPMVVITMSNYQDERKGIHPSDLDPHFEILLNWSPTYMIWHNYWWDPYISGRIEVDTTSIIVESLKDNPKHWSIVPKSVAIHALLSHNLQMCELTDPPPNRICYKITHRYPNNIVKQKTELVNYYLQDII